MPRERAQACGVPDRDPRQAFENLYRSVRDRAFAHLDEAEPDWALRLFESYLESAPQPAQLAVTHSDLTCDHLLYDRSTGRLGVIDFSDAAIFDPAADFVWFEELRETFYRKVLAHYARPLGHSFDERVRFCVRQMPFQELLYGLDRGDSRAVGEGLALIGRYAAEESQSRPGHRRGP